MSPEGSAAGGLPQPYHDFWNWVEIHMQTAIDGHGNRVPYVPPYKLREYWDWDRVSKFPGIDDRFFSIKDIIDRRLTILSILVFISKGLNQGIQYLANFCIQEIDDHNLPLRPSRAWDTSSNTQYQCSDNIPRPFSHQDNSIAIWEAFDKWQWQFCPLLFLSKGRIIEKVQPLDVRQILPVSVLGELSGRSNGATKLLKIRPHLSSGLKEESIVMKVYAKAELDYEYQKEIQAYTTIRNRSTNLLVTEKYFLRYHGSFRQGDKCIILVEYADEGSLLEFFKNKEIPSNFDESCRLWKDLSSLFGGLAILHNGRRNVGVHQDLKPANIFVFNVENNYGFDFKLGDFGMCSVTDVDPARETVGTDNHGTKMYSAPELCRTERDFCEIHKGVTWEADIWSLGCILLETAIWMHQGEPGRLKFLAARQAATRVPTMFYEAGYQGAFHNGHKALNIVREIPHQFVDGSPQECLSASITNFIVKEMLLGEEGKRLDAEQLKTRFQQAIEEYLRLDWQSVPQVHELTARESSSSMSRNSIAAKAKQKGKKPERLRLRTQIPSEKHRQQKNHDVDIPIGKGNFEFPTHPEAQDYADENHGPNKVSSSPVAPSEKLYGSNPVTSINNVSASQKDSRTSRDRTTLKQYYLSNYPHVTIMDVHKWMFQHKKDKWIKLKGMQDLLTYMANRDQVFVIDNSPSMAPFWHEVEFTCYVLSYVVKDVCPNGFDVAFTAKPSSVETIKRSSKLFERFGLLQLNNPKASRDVFRMEHVLSTLLPIIINNSSKRKVWINRVRQCAPRGVNVYVMTNGIWGGEPRSGVNKEAAVGANNVETAIQHAVDLLKSELNPRIYLSVQFIRFGNYAVGESSYRTETNPR